METNQDTKEAPNVVPMEVEKGKANEQPLPKLFDLPNQSAESLSMFVLVGLACTFICCVVWMWYLKNEAEFPERVTDPLTTELLIFTGIVCTIVTLGGLYGVKSVDRGWLLVTILGQICLVSTLNFGFITGDSATDEQIKNIDAFLLVSCTFTAWAAWRTFEKIQEEQLGRQRTLNKDDFGLSIGLDLPDMTFAGMEKCLIGTSICLLCFGVVFIILGAVSGDLGPGGKMPLRHMITCGLIQICAGSAYLVFVQTGLGRSRISLTITLMFAMLGMILICSMTTWMCFGRGFFEYECEGLNTRIVNDPLPGPTIDDCDARANLAMAQLIFNYFSGFLCAVHVWLSWRLSERVQTKALYDRCNQQPTNVSVFLKAYTILGFQINKPYTVYVQNLLLACFFTFAAAWGFLSTWYLITRADLQTEEEAMSYSLLKVRITDNYINLVINLSAVGTAMFGVYDNDRGFLLMATLLFLTATGYSYNNYLGELNILHEPNWPYSLDATPETWIKDVGRMSSFCRLVTLISSWFGAFNTYVISEIFQERQQMQDNKGSL